MCFRYPVLNQPDDTRARIVREINITDKVLQRENLYSRLRTIEELGISIKVDPNNSRLRSNTSFIRKYNLTLPKNNEN